jgi:hypothetical protein
VPLEEIVVGLGEGDVESGGREKPLAVAASVEEEAASAFGLGRGLSTDGDAECGGEGLADVHRWVDVEGGLEELGTGRADDFRLADTSVVREEATDSRLSWTSLVRRARGKLS